MSIAILPARLANQIAAGEVVERPASVVKELVENSLDAGATRIQVDIEKGGAKRIRIIDDGCGIDKDELTLALSRHATSKIKNLDDLEAISSLGFRGEALASISSVARLTLTSKPAHQDAAWQAHAEGRDMEVVLQPAAHTNGTTIDVVDLFFNTPARRKFLRTEKTEFAHIEEVIKRIALARFDVSFILTHNGKQIKNYRKVAQSSQNIKRIAAVCGQSFVDHAIEIDCQHDDIHLSGWIAKPSYTRKQNDLCYSYVNGRMMRDKLINHAIRQAYGEFIENDVYSAFVLFLSLDFNEVDVNVHPAKHEVRFHQGRYVHDFIYSVCHKALAEQITFNTEQFQPSTTSASEYDYSAMTGVAEQSSQNITSTGQQTLSQSSSRTGQDSYIKPLQQISDRPAAGYQAQHYGASPVSKTAADNYQQLMTIAGQPVTPVITPSAEQSAANSSFDSNNAKFVMLHQDNYVVYQQGEQLKLCPLASLAEANQLQIIKELWPHGLVSQPLLLPIKIKTTPEQIARLTQFETLLLTSGVQLNLMKGYAQIRQFPALLRAQDVTASFEKILAQLIELKEDEEVNLNRWQHFLATLSVPESFTQASAIQLWKQMLTHNYEEFITLLSLNSVTIDLTSVVQQLSRINE
ncbi:DNA mismatch repair endonuclease MutL [Thalassotalea agariperforans]